MKNILLVFIGAGIGGVLRYVIGTLISWDNVSFPFATFVINIVGSFLIGILFAYCFNHQIFADKYKLLLITGLCGGFTTFSTFSMETVILLKQQLYTIAFFYILLSVVIGIIVCWMAYSLLK